MLLVARALMTPAAADAGGRDQRGPAAVRDREAGRASSRPSASSRNTAILLIEQHVKFALAVADRYAVLKLGEIVDRGVVGAANAEQSITDHLAV